jgi:hypothetical protein
MTEIRAAHHTNLILVHTEPHCITFGKRVAYIHTDSDRQVFIRLTWTFTAVSRPSIPPGTSWSCELDVQIKKADTAVQFKIKSWISFLAEKCIESIGGFPEPARCACSGSYFGPIRSRSAALADHNPGPASMHACRREQCVRSGNFCWRHRPQGHGFGFSHGRQSAG